MAARSDLRDPLRTVLSGCIAVAVGATPIAQAATHVVSTNDDSGLGTLRQAIIDANADVTPPVIVDASTIGGTITLSTGEIAITNGMSVQGPGASIATIDANHASRIFNVYAPAASNVTISGFTLTNGKVVSAPGGGAVLSKNTNFTLENSTIDSSTASQYGGGIRAEADNGAQILISHVTLSNDSALLGGGAYLYPSIGSVVTVDHCVISGNSADAGGGLRVGGIGSVYVQATNLTGNHATGAGFEGGGGISGFFMTGLKKFKVADSTLTGNTAVSSGGGISVYLHTGGFMYIDHTLISGNTATNNYGGGLWVISSGEPTTLKVLNSTLSSNKTGGAGGGAAFFNALYTTITNTTIIGNSSGTLGGGIYSKVGINTDVESSTITNNAALQGGGVSAYSGTPFTLHNTVVANNTAPAKNTDTDGAFAANFNFVRYPGDAILTGTNNNTSGADPLLGVLGNYGGSTATKLPRPGSPLINAGDPADDTDVATDQRGLDRVAGAHIDIGADERQLVEDTIFLNGLELY
jgi:hypothetical protein